MTVETTTRETETGTWRVKAGLAQMLKGGVIMDVVTADQAKIAEDAGACAVMALERVPSDIRKDGGVARMSDPSMIAEIIEAVTIPVMAKARIGHFVEAQILESLGVDYIDESEVLTPADENNHVWKHDFKVPFVCGCRNLGEALRRIGEGAAMIRTKGEAGTGNVVEAVRHARSVFGEMRRIQGMNEDELMATARDLKAPFELVKEIHGTGKLPVVNFAAGGISTPAGRSAHDAARGRRQLRGIGHIQVRAAADHGPGHREGHHPLPGPGHARRDLPRPRICDARPGREDHARGRAARHAWMVACHESASLPSRAISRNTGRPSNASASRRPRCAWLGTWTPSTA